MHLPGKQRKQGVLCAIFAAIVVLSACTTLSAQNKWLVLTNGQTIEGTITLTDSRYAVVMQNGSRIIIGADRVNFVADSIEDIYWEKWSRVDPADADSHTSLFRWCLKNDLLEEAQKQIDLVAKLENMEDQASQLSRMAEELELVVARIEKEAQLAKQKAIASLNIRKLPAFPGTETATSELKNPLFAAAPKIPSVPLDANGRPVRKLEPMATRTIGVENEIELVDFEEEVPPSARVKTEKRDKPAWIGNLQLDRETRAFPDGTVSFYRRHVESKLIANCIQCHDSRSAEMPLSKRSFGQTIPRKMSQQNLHFVMEQVDRSEPLSSKLLTMATTAHGKQDIASFNVSDPFLFDLKKWTVAVSNDPSKWLATLAEQSQRELQKTTSAIQSPAELSAAAAVEEAGQIANEIIEVDPEPATDVDPYDPSDFNRK